MSITVHFGGKVSNREKLGELLAFAAYFATENDLYHEFVVDEEMPLVRIKDDVVSIDGLPVSGLIILPHPDAEPLLLFFDEEFILHSFCKTQFAGPEVHVFIIDFLRSIAPYFEEFWVEDEGDYWETGDIFILTEKMKMVDEILDGIEKSLSEQSKENKWKYN